MPAVFNGPATLTQVLMARHSFVLHLRQFIIPVAVSNQTNGLLPGRNLLLAADQLLAGRLLVLGVLAYFGYPEAHEDDAERAVHGALEIINATSRLSARAKQEYAVELPVRIGIATGLVVVGDLIGEQTTEETAVVGMTPNLAARMQELADLNTVVISDDTRRLISGVFEREDLGEHTLKGISEPHRVWRIAGRMESESRFQSTRSAAKGLWL